MSFVTQIARVIAAAATCVLLSACGGSPSEADLKSAVDRQVKAEAEAMERVVGKQGMAMARSMTVEIKALHKIGCKEDGEKAYRCDVELEVMREGTASKAPTSMRFVKGSDGWLVSR